MNTTKIAEIVWETLIKEFVKLLSKSFLMFLCAKLLYTKLPLIFASIIFLAVMFISFAIFYIKNKRDILNTYKALEEINNWDFAFAEKIILKLLAEKGMKNFLFNDNLAELVNKEFQDIENSDLEPEEMSVVYEAQRQINNKEQLNKIIENLIAREFVQPVNKKGLLSINSDIYNFILVDKEKTKKNIAKREKRQKQEFAKIKEQQFRKNKATIVRRIKIFFADKFQPLIKLSNLAHTWVLDVDGTIVKHNGYKIDGYDTLLPGVREFFDSIPLEDKVILLTARKNEQLEDLKNFLAKHNITYDHILTDMPMGERILVNDRKPSGLDMAFAINKNRDKALNIAYKIKEEL